MENYNNPLAYHHPDVFFSIKDKVILYIYNSFPCPHATHHLLMCLDKFMKPHMQRFIGEC